MSGLRAVDRRCARETADRLHNVARRSRLIECLTQDEIDWLELLRERLYDLGHDRGAH